MKITATDISAKALKIAKKNSINNNVKIEYIKTNIYQGINKKFDVIISNPPYIDKNSKHIEERVKKFEPELALFAKQKGLYYYEEILKNVNNIIKNRHIIAFEIGENQKESIKKIAEKYLPKDIIISEKDYNGFDRYLFIINKR